MMKENPTDRAKVPIPPPLFFFACLGFGLFLEYFFPLHIFSLSWLSRVIASGIFFLISGYLAISAFIVLAKNKTSFDPAKPTTAIVREGAFNISRNPMYLSLLFLIAGIAILSCSLWLFIAIPTLFILFDVFAVTPEETYLFNKFGTEYSEYKAKVRRWL
jgi:protein-S-isoprenylcysteine O-methyltransferase Ste14